MKMFDCNQGFKPRDISIIFFSSVYSSCMSILVELRGQTKSSFVLRLLLYVFIEFHFLSSVCAYIFFHGRSNAWSVCNTGLWLDPRWWQMVYDLDKPNLLCDFLFFSAGRKSLRPGSVVWRLSACTVLMVGHLCPNKLIKKYSKRCYIPFIWDKNDWLSAMT